MDVDVKIFIKFDDAPQISFGFFHCGFVYVETIGSFDFVNAAVVLFEIIECLNNFWISNGFLRKLFFVECLESFDQCISRICFM